jgi:hypothetical protein
MNDFEFSTCRDGGRSPPYIINSPSVGLAVDFRIHAPDIESIGLLEYTPPADL